MDDVRIKGPQKKAYAFLSIYGIYLRLSELPAVTQTENLEGKKNFYRPAGSVQRHNFCPDLQVPWYLIRGKGNGGQGQ